LWPCDYLLHVLHCTQGSSRQFLSGPVSFWVVLFSNFVFHKKNIWIIKNVNKLKLFDSKSGLVETGPTVLSATALVQFMSICLPNVVCILQYMYIFAPFLKHKKHDFCFNVWSTTLNSDCIVIIQFLFLFPFSSQLQRVMRLRYSRSNCKRKSSWSRKVDSLLYYYYIVICRLVIVSNVVRKVSSVRAQYFSESFYAWWNLTNYITILLLYYYYYIIIILLLTKPFVF